MTQLIDLGKLRFHFAGDWSDSTIYESNDIVKYGGNVYVYTHALKTAGNLPTDTAYWALMIEGFKFMGVFDTEVDYRVGDGIAHGGKVYVCVLDCTNQTPPNTTYWSQFADGIQYEGAYNGSTPYQKNDVVLYGGSVYIAKQDTTGNDPTMTAYWDRFVEGVSAKSVYNNATPYVPGDLVAYGPNIYRAKSNTTGHLPTDNTYWELFISGSKWQGAYNSSTTYYLNDIVLYGSNAYRSKQTQSNVLPTVSDNWELLVSGFSYQGVWSSGTQYYIGQVISYGGSLFQAIIDNQNVNPTTTNTWNKLVAGFKSRGNWATGTQYGIDEVVIYGGNTYISLVPHASTVFATDLAANNWLKFNSGVRFRGHWDVAATYLKDDIVQSGTSTYVCNASVTTGGDAPYMNTNTNFDLFAAGAEGFVAKSGDVMTGPLTLPADPALPLHAATKQYIDALTTATFEPTGFNRGDQNSMGIMEFTIDGTTIHKINKDSTYSSRTDGKFATGTAWEQTATANSFAIYPASGQTSFSVWQSGIKYVFTSLQKVTTVAPISGSCYFFIDQGALTYYLSMSGDYIQKQSFCALVYVNDSTGQLVVYGDERHGITMDGATHYYLHTTSGTRYKTGLGAAGVSAGGTTFTSLAAGEIWDEDIVHTIPSVSTAPMLYRNGTKWSKTSAANTFANISGGNATYNHAISAGNYEVINIPSGQYAVMYIMATNSRVDPFVRVMGQYVFTTLAAARESAQTEPRDTSTSGLPVTEFLWVGAVVVNSAGVIQTLDNGAYYVDLRFINISSGTNSSSAVQANAADTYFNNTVTGLSVTDVQAALNAFMANQSGNNGKVLSTNGVSTSWQALSASNTSYSNASSGISATTVQGAIDAALVKQWLVKTANYSASNGDNLMCDTSGGSFTITLPASPVNNAAVQIVDAAGYFRTKPLTVARNGQKIQNLAEDLTVDIENSAIILVYVNSTYGWRIV